MNVFDNVAYSLKLRKWPRERIRAKVEEMLALVRLEGYGGRAASELSGGQAQRVALARALAAEPQVLLLDEPLSALDLKLRQQMQLELRAIQRTLGATFVFVTHDQTEALVMSDRIAIMDRGRIVQVGTPREIYTRPSSLFVSDFIGQTNFVRGVVVASGDGGATLRIADGQLLRGESSTPLAPGSAATISIRPEAIRLAPGIDGEGLRGTIGEVIYLGGSVRVGVGVGDGLVWVDLRDDEAEALAPGDAVVLTWKPSAATVWAAA
jgi:ABC-type Fe3+/spermidine/putrescine transport system ATPase subunit